MLHVDYDKSFSFLQLVTVTYGLLAILSTFVLVFPALHNGEGSYNISQFELDEKHLVDYGCLSTASKENMGFELECVAQLCLLGSIVLSSCVAIVAAYYGIHWYFWHQRPETHLKCTYMVKYKIPRIRRVFPVIVKLLRLAFAIAISLEIVLFIKLVKEINSKDPSGYIIGKMESELVKNQFFFVPLSIILYFSTFLHNLFHDWDFLYEGHYIPGLEEEMSVFNILTHPDEVVPLARPETDQPPSENSSLATVV